MITRTLHSELVKLTTIRTTTWFTVATLLLSAAMTTMIGLGTPAAELHTEAGTRSVLAQGGLAAGIMTIVLGIVVSAGEYRHGTIVPTLLITPRRTHTLTSQVVVNCLAGTALGSVAVATSVASGLAVLHTRGGDIAITTAQLAAIIAGGAAFAGMSAALGTALGHLLANQVVALALTLFVIFLIEPVLTLIIDNYQLYSLIGIRTTLIGGSAQMAGDPEGGLMPMRQAIAAWTTITITLSAAAALAVRRREIA